MDITEGKKDFIKKLCKAKRNKDTKNLSKPSSKASKPSSLKIASLT